MQLARFENILAIRTGTGRVIGFHAHNLHVARLDSQVWNALRAPELAAADVQAEIVAWNREVDQQVKDSSVEQKVRSLTINVAQVCNLRCSYCAAGGDGTYGGKTNFIDISKVSEQISMFLAPVEADETFTFTFLGGEPLAHPEAIKAIVRYIRLAVAGRKIKVAYEITTNGTLVTDEVAELLADMNAHVTVSLDGPAEINDRVRPSAGGLGTTLRTLRGVEKLMRVKERLGSLGVNAVFGAHNIEVLKTYEYFQPMAWDVINLSYAAGPEDEIYSPVYAKAMADVADLAYARGGEKELRRISQFDHYFRILDGQSRIHNYCGAGKTLMQVDTEGRFYACNWFVNDKSEELGQGLTLDPEKVKAFADPLIELNDCRTCWAKHLCGGGCMFVHKMKSGNKHKTDEQFCERTRTLIAKGIDIYEKARGEEGRDSEVH